MTKLIIPATIEEATTNLDGIAALLTAKEWERAALVYAFTVEDGRTSPRKCLNTEALTVAKFAALKIKGLGSENTVSMYRRLFAEQVEAGTVKPTKPGMSVDLSKLPDWVNPDYRPRHRIETNAPIGTRVQAVRNILAADPELAAAVREEMFEEVLGGTSASAQSDYFECDHSERSVERRENGYSMDFAMGVTNLRALVVRAERGEFMIGEHSAKGLSALADRVMKLTHRSMSDEEWAAEEAKFLG